MKFYSESNTHVGYVRKANEDSYGNYLQPGKPEIWVVCDGMGGHVGGAIASKLAVDSIIHYWEKNEIISVETAMREAIEFANERILSQVTEQPDLQGMGTTLVMLAHFNDALKVAHVGDSRAYIFSNRQVNRLTKDHSYVQQLVDQGIIKDEDAEKHPQKNRILRALGISSSMEVEISDPIYPVKGEVFILCSDGLCGMINDTQMNHTCIQQGFNDLQLLNGSLISAALANGGLDNITVTTVSVVESDYEFSKFSNYNPAPDLSKTMIVGTNEVFHATQEIPETKENKESKWLKRMFILFAIIAAILLGLIGKVIYDEWQEKSGNEFRGR
jgi:PPM family protein phosphatase